MFDKHVHRAFAVLVSQRRTSFPVQDKDFRARWDEIYYFAIAIARMFATDDERFDAESWFEQCGFGKDPVQRATNLVGQLTRADIAAARQVINRP